MNKITKMMAVVVCASAFLVALPSPSHAAWCGGKTLIRTETNCLNGKTYITKHYMQTCKYDNGQSETKTWTETETRSGCIAQN
ncbi:hypothetical protein M3661_25075 [Paenibacillus sp. MER 180]|uniref:Uncharacterized protein n=1 Tax=Paenibacillus alvei TaxID=44250 RepID=A0ABT4E8W9_PAEAL|nr:MULTISPECIES: hypothetical protein [Paenibacillus]EPY11429.1 hypothetical protein PAAL66ix_18507 [Paenibacillus alvei A6-6i-x]MCM3293381.1 hypothetical protein [Paenibacillus sp. MER 180]MCY9530191.1 hypothetical protein [Paenibacillus alvei]OBY80725.1 hypothetical protein BBG47_04510 [Paenibacillus sp. KS1]SDF65341.1 hypothetical protein SAMN04488689_10682 [Paenibacillus sp. cl6col]